MNLSLKFLSCSLGLCLTDYKTILTYFSIMTTFKLGGMSYSVCHVETAYSSRSFSRALIFHVSFRIALLKSTQNPNKVCVLFLSVYKPGKKRHFRTSPSVYDHGVSPHLFQDPLNFLNWVVFSAFKSCNFVLFINVSHLSTLLLT